jgi:hypothetical protein
MHALQIARLGNPSEVVELIDIPDPDALVPVRCWSASNMRRSTRPSS